MRTRKNYGMEIIMDLHGCDLKSLEKPSLVLYVTKLCKLTGMTPVLKPKFWHETSNIPHLKGWSVVQFIKTSDIIVHTLTITQTAYINFFSCKDFETDVVLKFTQKHFKCKKIRHKKFDRI